MKITVLLTLLTILTSCVTYEQKELRKMSSMNTQKAIYKTVTVANDSLSYDTISVSIENGNFMTVYINDYNDGEKMELYEYYEPYQIDNYGDSVLRRTFINYDLIGDSIRYYEKTEWVIGQTKSFNVNGQVFKILKQPRWIFTKSEYPNKFEFYTADYGLILSLSKNDIVELVELQSETNYANMEKLIQAIKIDKEFFNLKRN